MAIRQLRPIRVLALRDILSSEGSLFSGVRRFSLGVERGELLRGCEFLGESSSSSSSSAWSFFAGAISSARSAERGELLLGGCEFVGESSSSSSSSAWSFFAGAISSARSAAESSGSFFAGASSSARSAAGRLLRTSARTKNGLPGPNYTPYLAILAAISSAAYLNSNTEKTTKDSRSKLKLPEDVQQIIDAYSYRVDKFLEAHDAFKPANLPDSVDWIQSGVVTHVRNQGNTSTCCMCAVISAVEAKHQILTGEILELSVQHLIDCSGFGCEDGSKAADLLTFLTKEGGCIKAEHYQYKGELGTCKSKEYPVAVRVNGFFTMGPTEEYLMYAVSIQPTIVSVCCSKEFYDFKGGRTLELKDCPAPVDGVTTHAVLVVAYGEDQDGLFWLILNSWGPGWGDKGFAKLRRGVADKDGMGVGGITGVQSSFFLPVLD